MTKANASRDSAARIRSFLKAGSARVEPAASPEAIILRGRGGAIAVETEALRRLAEDGAVVRSGGHVALAEGASPPRNARADERFAAQHRDTADVTVDHAGTMTQVQVNLAESPLAQLMRYKAKDGRPFLMAAEFDAGERLRADYTRGRIMPRLGANWEAGVSRGRRAGAGGAADLTDTALASRQRVDDALCAVGPELSGLLVDVCCFLKGLGTVERERGWPVRSAKVVLKTALSALARHYRPPATGKSAHGLHWGSADYRPSLG